jgi:Arc-like DNA binding domain
VLRLPADMHERLVTAALARRPKQSLSREILQRLEENFSHEDDVNLLRSTVESDPEFTRLWSTLMQEGGASKKFMADHRPA